jgi:DNA repair protein RadB
MKITSGSNCIDNFLNGGYEYDVVTTIYGPSGVGKTNLCLLAAVKMAESGKKVIFFDTEGGIAVERIKQISDKFEDVLGKIIFLKPLNFNEQKEIFDNIKEMVNDNVGMIVVDSISMLYRLELGKGDEIFNINSALGKQIAALVEITRSKMIPVLITNQVYSDFDNRDSVKMVGGDLLKYGSKCLIELQKFSSYRGMILRKHRHLPEGNGLNFKIVEKGVEEVE